MKRFLLYTAILFTFVSCIKDPEVHDNTPEGNFLALWEIIDTKYCYLDYKQIDWNAIKTKYQPNIYGLIPDDRTFFNLLGEMLNELKDGHVNLYSDFDISRYNMRNENDFMHFNSKILFSKKYLGSDYKIAGGLYYDKIEGNSIGYIYYGSFSDAFSDANIAHIFDYFQHCKGLIIDVRNNGGGNMNYAEKLASYFFTHSTTCGYLAHKNGPGHSDFSELVPFSTNPHPYLRWNKKVVILTNRGSYSATNDFVNRIMNAPKATVIGIPTGGGGGIPISRELPCGWMVRFSASPTFDVKKQHIESGIAPDEVVTMEYGDEVNDHIIDRAIEILKQ